MNYTLESLMESVGCEKWPERWNEIFDEAMSDFDKNGCPLLDTSYYDGLHEKYGILNMHLDTYKEAAERVSKDEAISRLLVLLCWALKDRSNIMSDLGEYQRPKAKMPEMELEYDMLGALAMSSVTEYTYELLKKRNVPQNIIDYALNMPENGINGYMSRNNGKKGYEISGWSQYAADGKLFRIGRFEIQIGVAIKNISVFRSDEGEIVALAEDLDVHRSGMALGSYFHEDEEGSYHAEIEETDNAWLGYPYNKDTGLVERDKVMLSKDRWKKVVSSGDNVVGIHIPRDGRLSSETVDEGIAETKKFLAQCYPDYDYKCFYCASWLCNPQLIFLLGEDKNISKFCKRFNPFTVKSDGMSVFYFVFLIEDNENVLENLDALPENTSLERALKEYYKSGKAIHGMGGYFFA